MKRLLVFCLILAVTNVAWSATYTLTPEEIDSMYEVSAGTLTSGPDASGNWTVSLLAEAGTWGDVQIGRDATIEGVGSDYYNGSWVDLSAYDEYSMTITNSSTSNDWFMATVYLNTGWTDQGQLDNYYEAPFVTWLAPGQSGTFTLDLTNVVNLNHVSSIGFKIGSHDGEGDYYGDELSGIATPEPATVCLLGLGGLTLLRRRKN